MIGRVLASEVGETGLSFLDGMPIGEYSFRAIVVFLVLMLFTGRVVTKRQLDDCREDLKLARATNESQAATLVAINDTLKLVVEVTKSTDHLLREITGKSHDQQEVASS